jgi:cysteine desulfuration protein SufE
MQTPLPARLAEIIQDFQFCEGREKIELLIQYSESLPPLPEWLIGQRTSMDAVPECMTPVFVQSEVANGRMTFHFDVPAESPTVRGFAAIMKESLDGSTAEDILRVPGDFYQQMGLHEVLTHQRLNGLSAILAHMKALAVKTLA